MSGLAAFRMFMGSFTNTSMMRPTTLTTRSLNFSHTAAMSPSKIAWMSPTTSLMTSHSDRNTTMIAFTWASMIGETYVLKKSANSRRRSDTCPMMTRTSSIVVCMNA